MSEKRVDSWPFDSAWAGYDDEGYPVYDRAVSSIILRDTFREFFTDGVFPSKNSELRITKGAGLTVNISEGAFIIDGCIGVVPSGGVSIPIDIEAGHRAYGVFLRNDSRLDNRSCYIVIRSGEPATSPSPPAIITNIPGVKEYRLGYVDIPTNATDLSDAKITMQKGSVYCPYAAPFESIEIDSILDDVYAQAYSQYIAFIEYLEENRKFIQGVLDGDALGAVNNRIEEVNSRIDDIFVDDNTFLDYVTATYPK